MLKNKLQWLFALAILVAGFTACEDPDTTFDPINPDLTAEAIVGTPQSTLRTLQGCERQLALALNEFMPAVEIASDNYANTQTFYNQFLDNLNIDNTDADVNDSQFDIARLRELAIFGRDVIAPEDPGATTDQLAELDYYVGVAFLMAGQYFRNLPAEPLGAPVSDMENLATAVTNFAAGASKATDADLKAACLMGQARANYLMGNKDAAVSAANEAIATSPTLIRFANFDAINGPVHTMQDAIHDRNTFDDLQPLPRLDFLDPKYNDQDPSADVPMPFFKIEEAHLILCEAAIADNELGTAQSIMKDIIGLVATRPTATFDESAEDRTQRNPGTHPNMASVTVAASPGAPMRAGLVLDRTATTTVPTVSGTSVTEAMIDAVGDADEALELLYLLRQEIFIAEGMRATDMGIKLPTGNIEQLANSNVKESDVTPVIPPFLDAIKGELDAFDYDAGAGTCTITHDVNAIIVANKSSNFVAPFHN
jgi:hypothetical protein